MCRYYTLSILLFATLCIQKWTFAQQVQPTDTLNDPPLEILPFDDTPRGEDGARIMFYNVENLFDTEDDPNKNDDEFTPTGMRAWSYSKFNRKLKHIYKVMSAVGGWEMPDMAGFCEVENAFVLKELVRKTPLRKYGYQVVLREGLDKRGIDVGFIYRKSRFDTLSTQSIRISFPFDTTYHTRDILYINGVLLKQDTLHIYINHWPSRYGGHLETDESRALVAQTLRRHVDSVYATNPNANIIIMGDLNDSPVDDSVLKYLRTQPNIDVLKPNDLYNLMYPFVGRFELGTHKHDEFWGVLDHIIVSPALLNGEAKLSVKNKEAHIYRSRFLLEREDTKLGWRNFRTYVGMRYNGGFSDHLPVYVDLVKRQ